LRKGERLPFDLAGIRTIFYDLSNARLAREAVLEVERFVQEFERAGYGNEKSGTSLGSLAAAVDRIDRKLDALRGPGVIGSSVTPAGRSGGLEALLASPRQAFQQALEQGDLDAIAALLPRMRRINMHSFEYQMGANILAINGYEAGAIALEEIIDDPSTEIQDLKHAVGGLVRFHDLRDTTADYLSRRGDFLAGMAEDTERFPEPADRAFFANQLGMARDHADEPDLAIECYQRATNLHPSELAFWVNMSMTYEKADNIAAAVDTVDRYMKLPKASSKVSAVAQAIDVYLKAGRVEDAAHLFNLLEQLDPAMAARKRLMAKEL